VVTPSGGVGNYSYQWYSNITSNTGTGTLISGATNPTFTPLNSVVGITYYYCIITQTGLGCSVTSLSSQVTVVAVPTISVQPIANQIICQNDPATALSVSVINGTGIPTFQWYSNTLPTYGGTVITGATGSTYTPNSTIPGTTYYYCIIQYANGGCGSLTSNISKVEIDSIAFIPNKTAPICSGETFNVVPSGSTFPEIVPAGTQYIWFVDPISNPLVTGASDNLSSPLPNISQTLNNNDTVPHDVVYHVTPITGSCQGAAFTITITINPKVIPNAVIGNILCNSNPPLCDGSITLNPTLTGTGIFTYQWNIPGTSYTQTNLCTGNYFVNITDSYSCTYHFPFTVTVPPAMISVPSVNPVNNTNCDIPTSCNGIIQVSITGGTPFASATNPYHFQWFEVISGSNIPIMTSLTQVNTSILQNLCGGTYLLVVTDGVNCQRQFGPYTITNPGPLVVTSTVSNYNGFEVSCNGGSNGTIAINVTGGINSGISITLNPGNITLQSPATFSGLSAGTYTAVIHDSFNNCPDIIRNFVLTQPATPVSATLHVVTPALCFGNQAIYEAIPSGGTGGYTFLWSNGITTPVVSNIPVGAFNCIITDSNGCQFILNGTNTPPPLLVANATVTSPILCFGGTATISVSGTGGTPGYFGDIGIHTGVPSGMSPIYTITDVNGCQATVTIPVAQPALLQSTAVITTPVACFGGNATITVTALGGTAPYTGTGSFNHTAGNYSYTVTDANGCSSTVSGTITQPSILVATASLITPILCNGNTGVILISGSGGTPFNTPPLYSGTGPITVVAGTGNYTINDANGCTAVTPPFTVNEPSLVVANATITSPILCHGGTATITVSATGGVVGTGYTGDIGIHIGVHAGTYTYTVKDSNNCVSNVTITVTEPPQLIANSTITSPILCYGGTAVVSVFGTGGTPGYFGDAGNHTVIAGTYHYNVIDANGCIAPTTITVTQPGLLAFTIKSTTNPNCFPNRLYDNGSICIKISGGTSPFPAGTGWIQSSINPDEWCLSGLSAGTYTISIKDINNCPSTSQTVTLTRPVPLTAFTTSNINVNCPIKEVSQTNYVFANGGVPGYTFNWSGGNACVPVNPQCMTTSINGNYFVNVNDQEGLTLGCIPVQVPINVNLPIIGNPLMNVSSNSGTICGIYAVNDPVTFTNTSTGNYTSVQWSIDGIPIGTTNSIIHNFATIGNHTITLVVNYAIGGVTCTYSISETIAITKGYDMIVPNAFTPGNHDNINDTIKPEFNCMGIVEMRVYDTWGSLLYIESGTSLVGWDGTIDGHESENGNYIIVVKATTLFGAEINYNGPFTLLK
jgi:gliding motility-associated-like protein